MCSWVLPSVHVIRTAETSNAMNSSAMEQQDKKLKQFWKKFWKEFCMFLHGFAVFPLVLEGQPVGVGASWCARPANGNVRCGCFMPETWTQTC